MWFAAAWISAFGTGAATLLSKYGIRRTDSTLSSAIRSLVVLFFALVMALTSGSFSTVADVDPKSYGWLLLSGIATGLCTICYYKALTLGPAAKAMPIEKSSIVLAVLFAIFFFHEREHLFLKLFGIFLIFCGIPFLIREDGEGSGSGSGDTASSFYPTAFLAMLFASLNTIFSKIGVRGMDSNLATALNTLAELFLIWVMVRMKGISLKEIRNIPRQDMTAILLSGMATGISWLCYYYAVKYGPLSAVLPINKMSVPLVAFCSCLFFREPFRRKEAFGLFSMVFGMLLIASRS